MNDLVENSTATISFDQGNQGIDVDHVNSSQYYVLAPQNGQNVHKQFTDNGSPENVISNVSLPSTGEKIQNQILYFDIFLVIITLIMISSQIGKNKRA